MQLCSELDPRVCSNCQQALISPYVACQKVTG